MTNTMLALFSDAKRIYGFCPCCDELFRLSDVHLYTKEAPAPTPFDDLDRAAEKLERSSELFASREKEIREQARRMGQVAARKRLKKLAPFFADQRIAAKDVKVLFHPVEYVVFFGLSEKDCSTVEFVDRPADSRSRERIQTSIRHALEEGNLAWQTYRVTDEGRVELESPRKPRGRKVA